MKATFVTALLAMGLVALSSCTGMSSLNSAPRATLGSVANVYAGTVISARTVEVEASATDKNIGTGIGAVVGAASGSLLGRGKGQIVSTAGFGLAGALAGRAIGSQVGKITAQELMIRLDGSNMVKRVTQPIYEQVGAIGVGVHGLLEESAAGSKFLPDGMQ